MADMFKVFDIQSGKLSVMNYGTICSTYDKANLSILKAKCISVISVFDRGKKIAIINRLREGDNNDV